MYDGQMGFTSVILVLVVAALLLLIFSVRNLRRRRFFRGGMQFMTSGVVFMAAMLLLAISFNLYTYSRLTKERPVARLKIEEISEQTFYVTLMTIEKTTETYLLEGNEWMLEARVLKWKGWANLLGLDSQFRLERLSGRYNDIAAQNKHLPSAWQLSNNSGIDVWHLVRKHPSLLPLVDASYGSATYLPMIDKVEYDVTISQSGLIARRVTGN